MRRTAIRGCGAILVGTLLGSFVPGCWAALGPRARVAVLRAPDPSSQERYCAWYGDASGRMFYFGLAPFWWALRKADGDPRADLALPGPQQLGRFDLERRVFLPPLEVGPRDARGGVWDVLVHPDGRVFFTTFFDDAGSVDPRSGEVKRFPGVGLNELALGEGGSVLATRYGGGPTGQGSLVVLAPDGSVRAEHPLEAPEGFRVSPKSVARDPVRGEIWITTDLLEIDGPGVGHDARLLGPDGAERLRVADPEIQFVAFGADGTGWFAEREGGALWLRQRPAGPAGDADPLGGHRLLLDAAFAAGFDFVQELRAVEGGGALLTRWSGRLHRVEADGSVRDLTLPPAGAGLYYTGVLYDGRVCATLCDAVEVVCRELP